MKAEIRQHIRDSLEIEDPATIAMLVEYYGASLQENIGALNTALQSGNPQTAANAAHALKGASANVGAKEVYEVTSALEKLLLAGHVNQETQQLQEKLVELQTKYGHEK